MDRFLLDTRVLIDLSKGRTAVYARIVALLLAGAEVGICAVNVAEFYAGLPPEQHPRWDAVFGALHYWDITRAAAKRAGIYRYTFARQGRAIATADALIAAVAVEVGATIITSNVKDYPMDDVHILSLVPSGA